MFVICSPSFVYGFESQRTVTESPLSRVKYVGMAPDIAVSLPSVSQFTLEEGIAIWTVDRQVAFITGSLDAGSGSARKEKNRGTDGRNGAGFHGPGTLSRSRDVVGFWKWDSQIEASRICKLTLVANRPKRCHP